MNLGFWRKVGAMSREGWRGQAERSQILQTPGPCRHIKEMAQWPILWFKCAVPVWSSKPTKSLL